MEDRKDQSDGVVLSGADRRLAEDLAFANYFMDRFESTYAVNLETRAYRVYKRVDRLERDYPVQVDDYYESLREYVADEVHPDDREDLLEFTSPENLRRLMRVELTVTHNFRVTVDGAERIYCLRVVRGADENNVAFGFLDVTEEVRKERDRERAQSRIKALERMSDETSVLLVDCVRDTCRTICDRGPFMDIYTDAERLSENFLRYVNERVSESDRPMMLRYASPAGLLERLRDRDEYSLVYQERANDFQRFCEMRVTRYSEGEVLLGFKEKSLEIVNRLILNRLEADYDVLFGINFATATLQVMKERSQHVHGDVGAVCPYTPAMREHASHYEGEVRDFFERIADLDYLRHRFKVEDKVSFVFRSHFGEKLWKTCTLMVLLRHEDGSPSLAVMAFSRLDAEAGEKAELQQNLQKALDAATGANRRNEAMHNILKTAAWSVRFNRNREVVQTNFTPKLFEIFRNTVNDIVGWTDLLHPDDRERAIRESRAALQDETGRTTLDVEYRVRARDGEYHWVRVGGRIILDASGAGEMYGICIDIDDSVKRRQQELQALDEAHALERANAAKSRFFSMVSHDIRTPLNAIIGNAELLKLGIDDARERARAIDSVLVSGQTLLELINDVLDLSKLEAGKMEIAPEPANARQLVGEITNAFKASVVSKSLEIRSEAGAMPWLRFDPHRVRQILFNLVGNAVKFTARGFVEIRAEYVRSAGDVRLPRGTLRFEVRDTGCGMTEEEQKHIAEPFVQVGSHANRSKGTGLGLAICKQLVAMMGGDMELKSAPGKGTTFRVILPELEEAPEPRNRLSMTQRIRSVVGDDQACAYAKVLIVDDQPLNRMVLKNILARFGVRDVTAAGDGAEALEKLKTDRFDLVLTDMWMPELDGEGLVREIRKNPAWAELPVYAITADIEAQKDYDEMGFTGLLLKPVTFEKLRVLFSESEVPEAGGGLVDMV